MSPHELTPRVKRRLVQVGLLVAAITTARASRADERAACIAATDQGQRLHAAHKLVEARAQFILCARPECPSILQQACSGWLGEVQEILPTVVITAKDGKGNDLVDVTVTVDDAPLTTKLDGVAVPVDPGLHAFAFSLPDGTRLTKSFLVVEGQKAQRLAIEGLGASAPSPSIAPAPGAPPPSHAGGGRRTLGIVVGSTGLASVVVGGAFGGLALSSWHSSKAACPTLKGCSPSAIADRSNAMTFGTVSDVGFGAGGALLAGGIAIYLTAPTDAAPTAGLRVTPHGVDLVGRF